MKKSKKQKSFILCLAPTVGWVCPKSKKCKLSPPPTIDMFYQKRIYLYFAPRSRMCDNPYKCGDGLDCIGESSEIKTVNGGWSEWSEWSELSDSYGCHSRYEMQCMYKICGNE